MKPRERRLFAVAAAVALPFAAAASVVLPENTDEILVNPDMGLVMFHYSNRLWAYGQLQERGDTLDWFPGVSTVYFRLPWCLLEPNEGDYRWDIVDSYAAPWIAAGKQIGLRITCSESRYAYATPEWVKDAGAKGWFFKMKMDKMFGKEPPGGDTELWEPDYGDPVFLEKLENFLKAMARRYDGNPNVAFIDVGSIGMWGEGHTRAYAKELKAAGRDPEEAFHRHYDMHRRIFPRTTLLCIDDQAGSMDRRPVAAVPLMKHAYDLGFGLRDDSILVFTPEMISEPERHLIEHPQWYRENWARQGAYFRSHPWWFHENWAETFAQVAPVFVEHEHYNSSNARGAWSDEKIVESVEAYHATWLSLHGWPKEIYDNSKEAYARAARRIGYRFELRRVEFPDEVALGEPFAVKSEWVNVGVARCYKGATLAWTLLDGKGRVAWVSTDYSHDFKDAEPKTKGVERPVSLSTRCVAGFKGDIPEFNDGIWVYTVANKVGNFANDKRVPTIEPGVYTLCVSIGSPDGTPRIALPLKNQVGNTRRYPVGAITVK